MPPSLVEVAALTRAIRACLEPDTDDAQLAHVLAWKQDVLARIEASERSASDGHRRVAPTSPPMGR